MSRISYAQASHEPVDIVGVTEGGRGAEFSSREVNSYELLDHAMQQVAIAESCEVMIALVREGENANLAKTSHLRLGWVETGYIIMGGPNGDVPYQVLKRYSVSAGARGPLDRSVDDLMLHHVRKLSVAEDDPALRDARPISYDDAFRRADFFALDLSSRAHVTPTHGSVNFVLVMEFDTERYNIHQLRPEADFWEEQTSSTRGSLDEVLAYVGRKYSARG